MVLLYGPVFFVGFFIVGLFFDLLLWLHFPLVLLARPDDIKFHQVRHGAIASLHAFVSRSDVSSAGLPSSTLSEMKQIMRLLRNDGDPETAHKAGLTALLLEKMETGV